MSDDEDRCPTIAEDRDGDRDTDGCPEEESDDDLDGVSNANDLCPTEKETINGVNDEDGCPDQGAPRVVYEDGEFQVLDPVRFQTGSARIEPKSYTVLNQVALVLKANPQLKRIRVEGHTDETGTSDLNQRLSEERAEAVRGYLIKRGVDADRLSAEGHGSDKPLSTETDEASRAKNRRVEFVIDD